MMEETVWWCICPGLMDLFKPRHMTQPIKMDHRIATPT